jgi:hypothetical protein
VLVVYLFAFWGEFVAVCFCWFVYCMSGLLCGFGGPQSLRGSVAVFGSVWLGML